MKHATFPQTGERSVAECLYWLPTIAKTATNEWAQTFAASIMAQSRRRGWKPTPKQLAMMRRMVAELFVHRADDDDLPVIE
ncbi:hypothetical protein [Gemmobacter sp. LW-1]|uniref:hypothetical protein n=1 Tax=Gemmobacter sp. LW-1 TaxID=1529005 RepID=UPI0006C74F91|nr:hypothetical protein [Gemmobacter sp. LW-1]